MNGAPPAPTLPDQAYAVLTTERVRLTTLDGRTLYDIRRSDIARVEQRHTLLILADRVSWGVEFVLASPMAGPARWDWYLKPAPLATETDSNYWGQPTDRLLGIVTDATRKDIADQLEQMSHALHRKTLYFDELPPEQGVDWQDVHEIVYRADGKGDGPSWFVVGRLIDGRWLYAQYLSEITGDNYSVLIVARSLESLWWGALTEDERDRVTAQMTREQVDEELVRLDQVLELGDHNASARASRRVKWIRRFHGL